MWPDCVAESAPGFDQDLSLANSSAGRDLLNGVVPFVSAGRLVSLPGENSAVVDIVGDGGARN